MLLCMMIYVTFYDKTVINWDCFFLFQVLEQIAAHKIQMYTLPDCDSDEDAEYKERVRQLKVGFINMFWREEHVNEICIISTQISIFLIMTCTLDKYLLYSFQRNTFSTDIFFFLI